MKVVINRCYGGFSLSDEAKCVIADLKNINYTKYYYNSETKKYTKEKPHNSNLTFLGLALEDRGDNLDTINGFYPENLSRNDLDLVQVVEKLGDKANGLFAKLTLIEIPDGIEYFIEEYNGMEWVAEKHRTWF